MVKARELTGPKGGLVIVMELECGCLVWQRRKVPARRLRCVTCWWKAQEDADARWLMGA